MNVSAEKVEIIQWLVSSEMEQKSIQKGIDDSKNGRMQPHSEIRKKHEKWL